MTPNELIDETVYELTSDVENPYPDKRANPSWSPDKAPVWTKGTHILAQYLPPEKGRTRGGFWRFDVRSSVGTSDLLEHAAMKGKRDEVLALLCEHMKPVLDLDSVLFQSKHAFGSHVSAEEILERLLDAGRITLDGIVLAAHAQRERNRIETEEYRRKQEAAAQHT